jgi:hypothetical protein
MKTISPLSSRGSRQTRKPRLPATVAEGSHAVKLRALFDSGH